MTIETETEYNTALKELDKLIFSTPDTKEYERMEELLDAVEKFEKIYYPMDGEE